MSRPIGGNPVSKRRTLTRRACVAVFTGLAAFAFIQLGLAIGVETAAREVRDPMYGCRLDRIRARLADPGPKPLTVVMLGSSRTQRGFRPGRVEKTWGDDLGRPVAAFNFGVAGGGPLTELLLWRRLQRDGVRPDLLLVEVMPPYLAAQVAPTDYQADQLPTARLDWNDLSLIERYAGRSRAGLRREWLRSWPQPLYAHRCSLLSLVQPALLPEAWRLDLAWKVDECGGLRFMEFAATPENRAQALQRARAEHEARLVGFQVGGSECEALRELLASCRGDDVRAVLVVMPEGPTFRSWYPPGAWQTVQQWLGQVSQEYGAPVVNAREWLEEDDFSDSHHQLFRGGDKFTERLGRECVVPSLRRLAGPTEGPSP